MGNRYDKGAGRGSEGKMLSVRLSASEDERLRELAAQAGLKVGEYVRQRLFGKKGGEKR